MLAALRILNLTVIEEVEVSFGPGLTVMTGETGAGKSILVDALSLLLGGRADSDVIRAGADEAVVEGLLQRGPVLAERLLELGLPDLGEELSVRRVVGRSGRGKAYVNGSLVTVGVLSRLMRGLIDVSGQHEHVGLFDPAQHRRLVDAFGRLSGPLAEYGAALAELRDVDVRLEALGGNAQKAQERLEFLRFQLDELERFDPRAGEETALEVERRRLMGADKLRRAVTEGESLVLGQDGSAGELMGRALGLLLEAAKLDAELSPVVTSLGSALAEVEEAGRVLSRYGAKLEADPARLEDVEERLDGLKRLCRKHGVDAAGLLGRLTGLAEERHRLENRQEVLEVLLAERGHKERHARELAKALTGERTCAAHALAKTVMEGLAHLAMPRAQFEVRITPTDTLQKDGADEVTFLFSANPGEALRPLEKVASGGEASRLLLALKRGLADLDGCQSYVLDEADAGVSGAIADVVGQMMRDVSQKRQVLCITHLPQVAAYADVHLRIEKQLAGGRARSRVVLLPAGLARAQELARMLSGVKVTREALGAAEALLRSAQRVTPGLGRGRVRRSA